jgi:VCBS repeat-containing protein
MKSALAGLGSVVIVTALLASCGGDSAESDSDHRSIPGAVTKGPLANATVEFFQINEAGLAVGAPVASATTDAQGHVNSELPSSGDLLLAVSSGGSYVDESDPTTGPGRRQITLAEGEGFEALVLPGAGSFSLTPYSMALLLRARRLANGANFGAVYPVVLAQWANAFGFDPTTVIPGDPLAPNLAGDPDAVQYAALLGGAAYAINSMALQLGVLPTYEIVLAFIRDLSDGQLDGQEDGEAVIVKAEIPSNIDLNAEVRRFLNNNFQAYEGVTPPEIDEAALSEIPELPDDLPPLALADAIVVAEGATATTLVSGAGSVLANDSDTGGATLTAILLSAPAHGLLTLNANGSFSYVHDGSNGAVDGFTYKANNGEQDSAAANVSITVTQVNDAPLAVPDNYGATEDTALSVPAPGVLGNDTDADGNALSAAVVVGPAHGSLALNANGGFTYTPDADFNGNDQFTYRANDGSADSNVTTVTIAVGPVSDRPLGQIDNYSTNEDTALNVAAPGVLANDTSPDGGAMTAVRGNGPAHGTLTFSANGSFVYTPDADYHGPDAFSYRAVSGSSQSELIVVNIDVVSVNDAPEAENDSYSTDEDTPLTVAGPGVLANDTDKDTGTFLTASKVSDPAHGTLTLAANGGFHYSPDENFNGADSFTYRASDGVATSDVTTVNITVASVNDAPIISDISDQSTNEDTNAVVAFTLSDVDDDVAGLTLSGTSTNGGLVPNPIPQIAFGGSGANRTVTLTPAANQSGGTIISVMVSDGDNTDGDAFTLTVSPVNDAPTINPIADRTINEDAGPQFFGLGGINAGPGETGQVIAISATSSNPSLVPNPIVTYGSPSTTATLDYTPASGQSGSALITVTVQDDGGIANGGQDTTVRTFTINVTAVNDPPTISDIPDQVMDEDSDLGPIAFTVDDVDTPLGSLMLSGTSSDQQAINNGDISFGGSGANRTVSLTSRNNRHGIVTITVTVSDGFLTEVDTFDVTINSTPDAPVAVADGTFSLLQDHPGGLGAPGVMGNDFDPDNFTAPLYAGLTAMKDSDPLHGGATLSANGSFSYSPGEGYYGFDSFTYHVTDGSLSSPSATVSLVIHAIPIAYDDQYLTSGGAPITIPAATGVIDNDFYTTFLGDSVSAVLNTGVEDGPYCGSVALNPNGGFTYTPDPDYISECGGFDSFYYHLVETIHGAVSNTAYVQICESPCVGN